MSEQNTYKQKNIDFLYKLQCCLVEELNNIRLKEEIGDCYKSDFYKLYIYYNLIKEYLLNYLNCDDLENNYCIDKDKLIQVITKFKRLCKECCITNKHLEC